MTDDVVSTIGRGFAVTGKELGNRGGGLLGAGDPPPEPPRDPPSDAPEWLEEASDGLASPTVAEPAADAPREVVRADSDAHALVIIGRTINPNTIDRAPANCRTATPATSSRSSHAG